MRTEAEIISRTSYPQTRSAMARQLRENGLAEGATVLVHASLSSLGWVAGGPVAVIQALLDCVGDDGTLVMPAHSGHLTDPAQWQAPPVPPAWIATLRRDMPAYDPATTPTRGMGAIAELFRTWPGATRSSHPTCSFAAKGRHAGPVTSGHALESPLGEASPLARLYDIDASILLLGVGFDVCTMFHLAEQRAWPWRPSETEGSPIIENGARQWKVYQVPPVIDSEHFIPIGRMMGAAGLIKTFTLGSAGCAMFPARAAVDFAVKIWSQTAPPGNPPSGPQ